MAAHARLSPSAAYRWIACPGSVRLSDDIAEDRTSFFAAEGTAAHEVREACLDMGLSPEDFLYDAIEADGFEIEVGEEMVEALTPGIERVRSRPGRKMIEERVFMERWLPECWGTLDCGIIPPSASGEIEIDDLKYGAGLAVSPERNKQLMLYGLGFWDTFARHETSATAFRLVIDQPRAIKGGGEWETSLDELLEFAETLPATYAQIEEGERFEAGEHCRFCPAKGTCATLAKFASEKFLTAINDYEKEDLDLPDLDILPISTLVQVVQHRDVIQDWLRAVHSHVLKEAVAGRPTPGLKSATGRQGPRKWADKAAAEEFLVAHMGAKAYAPRTPVSPTKAEEFIPEEALDEFRELITRSPGKAVLVPEESDKPSATMADKFEDME